MSDEPDVQLVYWGDFTKSWTELDYRRYDRLIGRLLKEEREGKRTLVRPCDTKPWHHMFIPEGGAANED